MSIEYYVEATCEGCGELSRSKTTKCYEGLDVPINWEYVTMRKNLNGMALLHCYERLLCPGCADRVDAITHGEDE